MQTCGVLVVSASLYDRLGAARVVGVTVQGESYHQAARLVPFEAQESGCTIGTVLVRLGVSHSTRSF